MANPFKTIINFFRKSYYYLSKTTLFLGQPARFFRTDNIDSYDVCWLVNTCIDKIAEAVAGVETKLYKVNKKDDIDEVNDHPLLDLLARPNSEMSGFEMLEAVASFLKLLGNGYLVKIRGEKTNKVLALEVLRPDWVRIYFEGDEKKYEYTMGGQRQTFGAKDIIPIKQFNPKDPFYGLPTVTPLMELIKTIIFTTRWNMNFFYNSARPDGILISKTKLSPEQKEELKKGWHQQYGGWEQAHKTAFFEGADIDYKVIQATAKDMQFSQLNQDNINAVLSAFGVPKAVIGMQGMNRAEAEAQIYTFIKFSVLPDIKRIFDKLNEFLVPEFGDNLFLDYGDPVPEDRTGIIAEYAQAWNKWLTINEIRDKEGLPPIEGGWSLYIPFGMMPIGEEEGEAKAIVKEIMIDSEDYYKNKREREQERLRKKILPKLVKRKEVKLKNELKELLVEYLNKKRKFIFSDKQKKQIWIEHDKSLTSDTKLFRLMVRTLFKKQKNRIKEAISSAYTGKSIEKAKIEIPIDWDLEDRIFVEVSNPVFTDIAVRRGEKVAEQLGEEFTMTERMRKFIDKKSQRFAEKVNETTWDEIKGALKAGIDEGEGVPELSERIDDVYGERLGYGSERIARTEVISASNEATLEAYRESEVVEKKEWLSTQDDRTREEHWGMNGEIVNVDEKFSNGLMFPGDPSGDPESIINCRCVLLPVVE